MWLRRDGLASLRRHLSVDVCIVGGGVIGSSVALQLQGRRPDLSIVVVERDATYRRASTPRSAGGIRQQFSLRENVELSMYGAAWLKGGLSDFVGDDCDVGFTESGYLTLASPNGLAALRTNHATQVAAGADWIRLLDANGLAERFPWLNVDGVAEGAFGERNEGYFDAWSLLCHTRCGARNKGVTYLDGHVASLGDDGTVVTDSDVIRAGLVVVAGGAWSARLVPELPVRPRRRCIFSIKCAEHALEPPGAAPLVIDTSGAYFRGDNRDKSFICGVSPREDPDVDDPDGDLDVDFDLYDDHIWPALAHRVPAFEQLKVESSWAGLYEFNCLDQNGVVGYHPDRPNLLVATGFSGHGLQHAPGLGRAVAELVDHGAFETIDLARLGFERLTLNEPLQELGIY